MPMGFRKGRILTEILNDFTKYREFVMRRDSGMLFRDNGMQFGNKFSVHLNNTDFEISPERITAFRLTERRSEKMLAVRTCLAVNEWVDEFKLVDSARILFYDLNGNTVRLMDFDIEYVGHSMECNYGDGKLLAPVFEYEIFR